MVLGLAVGHLRRGHQVSMAAILPEELPPQPLPMALRDAGVDVHEIRMRHRAYLAERRRIRRLCQHLRPDVVHMHGYHADVVNRDVVARLGIPAVTTIHGADGVGGIKGAFFEWLQRRNWRAFDAVVPVSERLLAEAKARGVPERKLHLIPNAWGAHYSVLSREAARSELGIPSDATVVGWVGRLVHVKAADIFLDALERLDPPRPLAVVIGYGELLDALRQRAAAAGLDIRFMTEVRDAGRLFAAFDAFVLSSRSEGLPITLLEAIAAGVPIVATRVGGVPDILGDQEAYLVDRPDAGLLASAMQRAMADREDALRRATAASALLRGRFSTDRWLDRYSAVYDAVSRAAARSTPA